MAGDANLVLTERRGAVALITLNRPQKRNALSIELRRLLARTLEETGRDGSVAAVVLTGAPPAFCAGMDTGQFGGDEANRRALFDSSRDVFGALLRLPIPIVAAVNGPALGGGAVLAAECDLRIAAPSATFGSPEVRLGIPASYGSLLRVLPDQLARELAYTGRILSAEEALALGVVREVAEDAVARALALAEEMAALGRPVLEMTKGLIVASTAGGTASRAWEAELAMFHRALFPEE